MGFIKEVYANNRAGLVVAFGRNINSSNYFNGNNIEDAMSYFNMYLKGNELYIRTEDEIAIADLGIKASEAVDFRESVDNVISVLTDEQAIEAVVLFPEWKVDTTYEVNMRVRYENKLYRVLQAHTSQENWKPNIAYSLFAALLIDEENNTIQEWVQPDSTNGYKNGDKVIHNEMYWVSTSDDNIWMPGEVGAPWAEYIATWQNGVAYGLGQKVIFEGVIYYSLIENNTQNPTDPNYWMEAVNKEGDSDSGITEIKEWEQPSAGNAYMIGDKVKFEEEIYESLIDNNVWSPATYPAGWNKI